MGKTSYQNNMLDSGKVGTEVRVKFLEAGSVTTPQILKKIDTEECSFENMKTVVKELLENSSLDMLFQGNARQEDGKKLFNEILTLAPINGKIGNTGINVRKLDKNETMHINSFNTRTSDNHFVTKYYQYKPTSAREALLIELFTDIISESTFN